MRIIRVEFQEVGKKYYYNPKNLKLKTEDKVVVVVDKVKEIATIYGTYVNMDDKKTFASIKKIERIATKKDLAIFEKNQKKAKNNLPKANQIAKKYNLNMKILNCKISLDGLKTTFFFKSENRVDFRALVKELAVRFKSRIELRQIGERDSAKMIGGIGLCGLILCCNKFIGEFNSISIKLAKLQNLSLNISKISGQCGKLLCCLNYEKELYKELSEGVPKLGKIANTPDGEQKVIGVALLKNEITTINKEYKRTTYKLSEVSKKNGNNNKQPVSK